MISDISLFNLKKLEIRDFNKGIFYSNSVDETISHGFTCASKFSNQLILLQGSLGVGKTMWVKGLVWGLGIEADVYSPTFTIMNNYSNKNYSVFHLDLYRINHIEELHDLGLFEIVEAKHTCVIEWPERLPQLFSLPHVHITIEFYQNIQKNLANVNDDIIKEKCVCTNLSEMENMNIMNKRVIKWQINNAGIGI